MMVDDVIKIILGYGPAGVVIVVLLAALYRVDTRRNQEIEARLRDALVFQTTVLGNTDALQEIATQHRETNRVIEALAISQRGMSESINILNATIRAGQK